MATATVQPAMRDRIITEFRQFLCREIEFVPFEHQAAWWVTTDGYDLTDIVVAKDPAVPSIEVRLPSGDLERRLLRERSKGRARVVAELGAY